MIASAAVTTGLFVLAGVVVGGLVTGTVNYAFESRREQARLRVAVRLVEAELLHAAAQADFRFREGEWYPWDFESAPRTWREYRADIARLPSDDWFAVSLGYFNMEQVVRNYSNLPIGAKLDADQMEVLNEAAEVMLKGANILQRHQGLEKTTRALLIGPTA